ncbi:MAG: hypothetical protein WBV22_04470 [Anaerolineaceae bacterium]
MEIRLLYFDGCQSWKNALNNLHIALGEECLDFPVQLIEVKSDQEAAGVKFLGSPSFQVDGKDFWPEDRQTYSMNCRLYRTPVGLKGWPTVEMLRQKLQVLRKDEDQVK